MKIILLWFSILISGLLLFYFISPAFAVSRTITPSPPLYPCGACSNTSTVHASLLDRIRNPFYKFKMLASLEGAFSSQVVGVLPCPPPVEVWQPGENGPILITYTTNGADPFF